MDELAGIEQLTASVDPNGRSSTIAPAGAPSASVSPPLASTRRPATGAAPLMARRRGSAGTVSSTIGSSESAVYRLTCSGSAVIGCGPASATTPPSDAGDVRVDARERANHRQRRAGRAQPDADAAQLLEIDGAAARDQRAVREIGVAQHAALIGRRGGERIDQPQHVGSPDQRRPP